MAENRRTKKQSQRKSDQIAFRCTLAERRLIENAAHKKRVSLSDYVLSAVLEIAKTKALPAQTMESGAVSAQQ